MSVIFITNKEPGEKYAYAIIDRIQFSELEQEIERTELIAPQLQTQAHLYPWLISMNDLPHRHWKNLVKQTQGDKYSPPQIKFLFNSQLSLEQIKRNLVNAMYLKDINGDGCIVRYYDPLVFFQYCCYIKPEGVRKYLSMDNDFEVAFFYNDHWLTMPKNVGKKFSQVCEKNNIEEFVFFSKCIKSINRLVKDIGDLQQRIEKSAIVFQAMLVGNKKIGLHEQGDLEVFAKLYMEQGADFYKNHEYKEMLKEAATCPGFLKLESRYLMEVVKNDRT